ncbi:super-infection exclusion protein B [Providencia rettgeri]
MELLAIIGRVLKSEPLERVMWFIIVWVTLLMISPDSWGNSFNSKIGIPYVWQVFIFAISFVIAVNTQRLVMMGRDAILGLIQDRKLKNEKIKKYHLISSLSEDEKGYLAMFIDTGKEFLGGERNDPVINSLLDKDILHDSSKHLSMRYANEFIINPDYYSECVRQFTGYFNK